MPYRSPPFTAKRLILSGQHDYTIWLAADYTARVISIFGVVLARRVGLFDGGPVPAGLWKSILVLVAVLVAQFIEQLFVYPVLHANLDYFDLSGFPYISNPSLQILDVTFGLLLVAISEEYAFRALFTAVLERWQLNSLMVIAIGAAAFALIHLTSGLADTLSAFLQSNLGLRLLANPAPLVVYCLALSRRFLCVRHPVNRIIE